MGSGWPGAAWRPDSKRNWCKRPRPRRQQPPTRPTGNAAHRSSRALRAAGRADPECRSLAFPNGRSIPAPSSGYAAHGGTPNDVLADRDARTGTSACRRGAGLGIGSQFVTNADLRQCASIRSGRQSSSLVGRIRGSEPAFLGGDSVPAQIGDIGHVFKAVMGFWFPTLPVIDQGYVRVRVRTGRSGGLTNSVYGTVFRRVARLRWWRATPAARRSASAIAAVPGSG